MFDGTSYLSSASVDYFEKVDDSLVVIWTCNWRRTNNSVWIVPEVDAGRLNEDTYKKEEKKMRNSCNIFLLYLKKTTQIQMKKKKKTIMKSKNQRKQIWKRAKNLEIDFYARSTCTQQFTIGFKVIINMSTTISNVINETNKDCKKIDVSMISS